MCSKGLPTNQQRDVGEDPAQAQLVEVAEHVGGVASELADVAQRWLRGCGGSHRGRPAGAGDPGGPKAPSLPQFASSS